MKNLGCHTDKFQTKEISKEELWYMYKCGDITKEAYDELIVSCARNKQSISDNQF